MNPHIIQLIGHTLDRTISKEDFANLQQILRDDPESLEYYCQQAEMHGRLSWELQATEDTTLSLAPQPATKAHWPRYLTIGSLAAALALAAILSTIKQQQPATPTPIAEAPQPIIQNQPKKQANSIARITNTTKAIWNNPTITFGSWVDKETIELLKGRAEITFNSGTRLILQAPATLHCIDPYTAWLESGKAVVHGPKSSHFQLKTAGYLIKSPSASYALAVDEKDTEVHTITGVVAVKPKNSRSTSHKIKALQRLSLNNETALVNASAQYKMNDFRQELDSSKLLTKAEFLHWSFDDPENHTFLETGNHSLPSFHAVLKHENTTNGRAQFTTIKGKFGNALNLKGDKSYLATQFEGIEGSTERTIAFWVRIPKNALNRHSYSIFSWGIPRSLSGEKWQIAWNTCGDNQGVHGAIRTEFGGGFVVGETNIRDGRWHHVTSVYKGSANDNSNAQILHYIDGKLEAASARKFKAINTHIAQLSNSKQKKAQPAFIGKRLEDNSIFDSFRGGIDELYAFPAALTPSQIADLYEFNKPPESLIPFLVSR